MGYRAPLVNSAWLDIFHSARYIDQNIISYLGCVGRPLLQVHLHPVTVLLNSYQPAPRIKFNSRHDETFLSFILPMHCNGDASPNEILAPLQRESCIGNRDGISPSMSPPRAVKLLPDDEVSIDIPPYDHVSSYDKTVSKYNAENKIPPKEVAAINTYPAGRQARGIPIHRE
ncbi:hypothetical protein H4Q26_007797 [Puccinia striiformis f. sp. tritici PST-130]|nr:hypothetical protein H4Q26_007797 [Puccinia striiformis f. sp. tritici PST-130]